ncbi:hypothetical protein M405DRAFT_97408 [Rhizopogon salebrosus TDB-379]|nr:hypothetical protein M405DRAFT_100557 [Rhizopogon salebrosus TDB-379]KAJ8579891.1 hypothetical protein M405DRAFT_97408 [Rhizopogon salebrosus TDB-379]
MLPTTPYVQSGEPLNGILHSFLQQQVDAADQETPYYRYLPLPRSHQERFRCEGLSLVFYYARPSSR